MRCLAIDDEPLALSIIQNFCSMIPFVELCATASNAVEASSLLKEEAIDLLFLDINMPHISGIELAKTLKNPPMIIFTTAYPDFALEGFEVSAVDYLVKPFSFERFFKAVNKAYDLYVLHEKNHPARQTGKDAGSTDDEYIMVKVDYSVVKVMFDDILFVEGLKDYVKLYTKNGNYVTKSTMKNIEDRFPVNFMRIHKSVIVNLKEVESFENNHVVVGGHSLALGSLFKEPFLAFLHKNKL